MSTNQKSVANRSLLSLSWPILIELLLHFATPFINVFMVGRLSTGFQAAMTAGNQVFDLCVTIFSFISVGCSVVIAQYLGVGKSAQAKKAIHISISFNLILGTFFALFAFFFGYYGLKLMNTPADVIDDSFVYLHILGICLIPEAASIIMAACLRVYGKVKAAMLVTLTANVITVIGNILVLYGLLGLPQLGLWGVAWSTVIGRVIAVILFAFLLSKGIGMRFYLRDFIVWQKDLLKKILYIGLPAAGENLLWTLQYMTAIAFIGLMGTVSLASQGVYFQWALFMMMFGIAISIANEIQVGYLVGEKRFDEAYKRTFKGLRLGILVTICVVVIFWLASPYLLEMWLNDTQVIEMIKPLFLLALILEPGRTINIVMVNALRATGDARFPLYMGIIFMWGVSIPLGYYLGIVLEMGLIGIWLGFLADEWLRGLANAWRWKSRIWQSKRLDVDHS